MPRLTVIGMVTVPSLASTPPVCAQVTVAPLVEQLKVAVLPAPATVAVMGELKELALTPLAIQAGTVSVMRTPVASCGVVEALVTTSV